MLKLATDQNITLRGDDSELVMRIGLNSARSEGVMQDATVVLEGFMRFMSDVQATCITPSLVVLFKHDVDSYEMILVKV